VEGNVDEKRQPTKKYEVIGPAVSIDAIDLIAVLAAGPLKYKIH